MEEDRALSDRLARIETEIKHTEQYKEGHDGMHDEQLQVLIDIRNEIFTNTKAVTAHAEKIDALKDRMDRQFERSLQAAGAVGP